MVPADSRSSRYRTAVQRAILNRRAALAALALVPGVACGTYDDAELFRSTTTVPEETEAAATDTAPAADKATSDTAAVTVPAPVTATTQTPETTTTQVQTATTAFAAGAELAVSFTFTPAPGGRRIENPIIAVGVENADGVRGLVSIRFAS